MIDFDLNQNLNVFQICFHVYIRKKTGVETGCCNEFKQKIVKLLLPICVVFLPAHAGAVVTAIFSEKFSFSCVTNRWFSRYVTAVMLVHTNKRILMNFILLCAPTWPSWPLSFESHRTEGHVSENHL